MFLANTKSKSTSIHIVSKGYGQKSRYRSICKLCQFRNASPKKRCKLFPMNLLKIIPSVADGCGYHGITSVVHNCPQRSEDPKENPSMSAGAQGYHWSTRRQGALSLDDSQAIKINGNVAFRRWSSQNDIYICWSCISCAQWIYVMSKYYTPSSHYKQTSTVMPRLAVLCGINLKLWICK